MGGLIGGTAILSSRSALLVLVNDVVYLEANIPHAPCDGMRKTATHQRGEGFAAAEH
jgi:hypothetical protein